jgi:hypothetical protein
MVRDESKGKNDKNETEWDLLSPVSDDMRSDSEVFSAKFLKQKTKRPSTTKQFEVLA